MSELETNSTIRSQIDLDIQTATDSEKLIQDIQSINGVVSELAEQLRSANVSSQSFSIKLSESIQKTLNDLKNSDFKISGETIEKKFADTLSQFIASRDVLIKSGDANLEVTPSAKFWNAYKKAINQTLEDSIVAFKPNESTKSAINLNPSIKKVLSKLNDATNTIIDEHIQIGTSSKDLKFKPKLEIRSEQLEKVMYEMSKHIIEQIASPDNIVIEGIPPMTIKADSLKKVVEAIQGSIGDIEKYLGGLDADALKNLPKIDPQLDQFDVKVRKLLAQVMEIQKAIMDLNPEIEPENMRTMVTALTTLNSAVNDGVAKVINSVTGEIRKMPFDSLNYGSLSNPLDKLDKVIQDSIIKRLDKAEKDLMQAMGVSVTNVDGKEVYLANMRELNERVVQASRSAVENLKGDDIQFDMSTVQAVATQLSKQFDFVAKTSMQSAITEIVSIFLSVSDDIANKFKELAKGYTEVTLSIPTDAKAKALEIPVDLSGMKEQFKTDIVPIITEYVNNMKFRAVTPSGKGASIEVTIPKSVQEKIGQSISKIIEGQSTNILNSIKQQTGTNPPEDVVARLNTLIDNNVKAITDTVIEKTKTALNVALGSGEQLVPTDVTEQAQISQIMSEQASQMINQYTEQISGAFGGVVEATSTIQAMVMSMQQTVLQGVQLMLQSITFNTEGMTEIQLDMAVQRALKSVEKAVISSIKAWTYTPSPTDIGGENVSKALTSKIEKLQATLLKHAVDSTVGLLSTANVTNTSNSNATSQSRMLNKISSISQKYVNQIMQQITDEITTMMQSTQMSGSVTINPNAIKRIVSPLNRVLQSFVNTQMTAFTDSLKGLSTTTTINTRDLHQDVKRRIANQLQMTVSQLTANFPTMDGADDLRNVMQHNIQYLMDRFNSAVLTSATSSMKDIEQALKAVVITTDTSVATMLGRKMNKLQAEINKKIKEMLTLQFNALTQQIQNMRIYPMTVGYRPSANVVSAYSQSPAVTPAYGRRGVGSYNGAQSVGYSSNRTSAPFNYVSNNRLNDRGYNPGGDTKTFAGSVVNTMRYMTAGALMGLPAMAMQRGFQATKEFDYNMTKAQQNFLMKDPDMEKVAREFVFSNATEAEMKELNSNADLLNKTIAQTASEMKKFVKEGSERIVQDMAIAFSQSISDASMAFSVASRNIDSPLDAQLFAKEVLKLKAVEEMDIETSALGLQAIQAQWNLDVSDLEKATNMLIKTATLSSVTAEDLLQTQSTSGSLFMNNLAGMTKGDALATSFALSSLFTQSTAKSGSEGGTYFKAVLEQPFDSGSAEALQKMSQYEGFENLNPYKEDGVTRKDYLELLGAIIDASDKLSDKGKTNLFEELFPGRYTGSATAITELVKGMKEELKGTTAELQADGVLPQGQEITAYDTMKAYIDNISSATEDEIMLNVAGMQNTWDMTIQRTQATAESLAFELFDNFKSDFTVTLTYLNSFLRSLRDNADTITGITSAVGKAAVGIAGTHLIKKGGEKLDALASRRDFKSASGKMFFTQSDADEYDDMSLQVRAHELTKQSNQNHRLQLQHEIAGKNGELDGAIAVREQAKEEYHNMQNTPGTTRAQLTTQGGVIQQAENEVKNLRNEIGNLESQMRILDNSDRRVDQGLGRLNHSMTELTGGSTLLDVKFGELEVGLMDAGMDTLTFNRRLNELRQGFDSGRISINSYEQELLELGTRAGMTEQETLSLKSKIDGLNRSLATGRIDASQYAIDLQRIRAGNLGSVASVAGTGGGTSPATSNSSLINTMIAGSVLTGGASGSAGIFATIGKVLAKIPVIGKMFAPIAKAGAKIGSRLGIIGKIGGKFLKFIPQIGTILTLMEVVPNLLDGIFSKGNTLGENMQKQAQNAKKFANTLEKMKSSSSLFMRGLYGFLGLWDATMNGINHMLGGNKMSFSESYGAWAKGAFTSLDGMDADEYEQWLKDNVNYDQKALDANLELTKENLSAIDPIRDATTGKINDKIQNGSYDMTLEDMQTLVSKRTEGLNDRISINDTGASKQKLNLLLQGYKESSEDIQNVLRENLSSNNEILQETIDYLREYLPKLAEGTAKDYLTAQIEQLEVTKLQNQIDIKQSNDSVYDTLLDKYNYNTSMIDAEYGIKESDALISGYKDDSTVVKQVGISKNRALVNEINSTQSRLEAMLTEYSQGSEMYEKIWLQIMQLESEEKSLLATISKDLKEMGQVSTFNLPSGVTPITYWEAMTKNNTHKNMTVKAGDTSINITIEKMSGSEEDIEKMATTIDQVVKDATKNSTYAFDSNVKSGMGNTYYPHTRV